MSDGPSGADPAVAGPDPAVAGPDPVMIVDVANVMGSRPDGWWRDRAGAAERLIARIGSAAEAGRLGPGSGPVVVVLEGRARAAAPEVPDGVVVVRAEGSGDDAIVAAAAEERRRGSEVVVVTADRALQVRVRRLGSGVTSPQQFLGRI